MSPIVKDIIIYIESSIIFVLLLHRAIDWFYDWVNRGENCNSEQSKEDKSGK